MRIATWNVNSLRARLPRVLAWLEDRQPDVVCLQETKMTNKVFDELAAGPFQELGYEVAHHGQGQWNGIALLSKVGLDEVQRGFDGQPDFNDKAEARAISATCQGVRIHCLYVPNGREIDDPHYEYKLAWLDALKDVVAAGPADVMLCGDMNIAPADEDVFDIKAFEGLTHVTQPERDRLTAFGLVDVVRDRWPDERIFSYWDYRGGMFYKDQGMRIDLILASASVAKRTAAAWVDREARKGQKPSDHTPVIVDLDVAPDGDLGPVVNPPSRR